MTAGAFVALILLAAAGATLGLASARNGISPVLVLTVFAVAAVAASIELARRAAIAYPLADISLIELYTRDALRGRLLVGPYSHFPWHHPGPLYFYLLAPFYVLGGGKSAALNAGAFVLGLGSVSVVLWVAHRACSPAFALAIVAVVSAYALRLAGLLVSVWNPHVVVLPVAAALVAVGALAAGDGVMLPVVAVLGSFIVQTDVALAPVLAAAVLVGTGACVRRRGLSRTQLALATGLLALMWLPTAVEQLTNRPGNLTALWRFFSGDAASGQTFPVAFRAWAGAMTAAFQQELTLPIGGAVARLPDAWNVVAPGLVVTAGTAAAIACKTGRPADRWFSIMCVVSSIVALWSATRIAGPIADHQLFWASMIGALDAAAIGGALLSRAAPALTRVRFAPVGQGAALALTVTLGLIQMNRVRLGSAPVTVSLPSIPAFGHSIAGVIHATGARKALVRLDEPQWGVAAGILLQMERLGIAFAVEDDWASMFPHRYRATGDEDVELAIVATGSRPDLSSRRGDILIDASTHVEVHGLWMDGGSSSRGALPRP